MPRLLDLVQHVFDRFGEQARRFGTDGHGRVGERGGHGVDGGVHERGRGFTPHEHPSAIGGGHRHGDTVDGGGVERRGVVAGVARERRAFGGDVGLGLALGLARRVARLVRFVVVREERVLVAAVRVRSLGLCRARVGEPVEIFVVGARLGLRGTRLGPYGGLVERAAVLVLVGGGVLMLHRVHHVHLVVVRADVHVGVVLDERIEVVKVAVVHGDRRCLFAERDSLYQNKYHPRCLRACPRSSRRRYSPRYSSHARERDSCGRVCQRLNREGALYFLNLAVWSRYHARLRRSASPNFDYSDQIESGLKA